MVESVLSPFPFRQWPIQCIGFGSWVGPGRPKLSLFSASDKDQSWRGCSPDIPDEKPRFPGALLGGLTWLLIRLTLAHQLDLQHTCTPAGVLRQS